MTTSPLEPERDERRRLLSFINAMMVCAGVVIVFEAVTFVSVQGSWLLVAMATLLGLIGVGRWAQALTRRGDLLSGARVAGSGLLGAVLIYVLLLPRLFPVLCIVPLTAMALVLPHLRPERRRALVIAAWLTAVAITVLGVYVSPSVDAPESFIRGLIVVGLGAVSWLTLILLSQFDGRQREQLARVEQSEARLRTLVETAADGVLLVERGVVIDANVAASRLFGVEASALVGADVDRLVDPTIDEGPHGSIGGATTVGRRADGGVFPAEVSIGDTADGRLRVYVVRDVTDRAQATAELARRADALARSNRELEQFAYVASHDLQEPLRKIQAFATLLDESARERLGPEERQALDYLTDAATRQRALINDLLAYSRARTRPRALRRVPLDSVLAEVLEGRADAIGERGALIDAAPLPTLEADRNLMRQLFDNLVSNALKFAHPDRRPRITIRCSETTHDDRPVWQIAFTDDGIGFEARFAERIFEPFRRLHGRHEFPGSGVGLAICRQIVERHGGVITAEGRLDEGATFTVTLPRDAAAGAASDDDAEDAPNPQSRDSAG